jgi:PAS domain S-box-containing protein
MVNHANHAAFRRDDDPGRRLLFQAIPGCAALVNGEGLVEAVNPAWAQAGAGNPFLRDQGPGSDYLAHCRALAGGEDTNHALVAASIVSALQGKIRRIKLEYPVGAGAQARWFSMAVTGLEAPAHAGVVVAHLDITERMAWETRVRRTDNLFKVTTENALDLIAIVTAEGRTVYASPSYGKALGHGAAAMAGGKLLDLVCPADQPGFRENCRIGLRSGISPLFEYSMLHRDGQVRQLEARAVAVDNPGGERDAILLISRDISAKKEAERERLSMETRLRHAQKMEAVGQLAAGIAHEINTPCQYLSDNLRFLQEAFAAFAQVTSLLGSAAPEEVERAVAEQDIAYLTAEVPQAIQQSLDGLARIATIVQAMKVFGHPGGDERVAVDLNETLRNTIVVAQGEWKHVAEVEADLDPQLPAVLCSPGEMNQVFLNLLVNAAHAIAERPPERGGKGRIVISSAFLEGWVEIRVRDTGSGIPEAIRTQIFLPFFTTKPVGKGTGQGLAIVHSVVTKNGGSIDFETEVGHGTCFIVRLPAKA